MGNAEDGGGVFTSSASEGVCVFGAWVGCNEDSCKQEKGQVVVGR